MKTAADVYSPVDGNVTDVNSTLTTDPAIVNKGAEKEGWLFKFKVSNGDPISNHL